MGLAPNPQFPEKGTNVYERGFAPSPTGNEGPRRFEEGVASDTDVPNEFAKGAGDGKIAMPITYRKSPAETMQERAHVGSASWIEAPTMLGDFAHGTAEVPQTYGRENRGEGRKLRRNPTTVEG
jgi:hypothetical protein